MKRLPSCLVLVLGVPLAVQHAACVSDVQSASPVRPSEITGAASTDGTGHVGAQGYDFCAAYPTGSAGCALCGHEDLSLDPGQEHVTTVDLTGCAGDVSFGHFSVVEYIKGGRQVQSLDLRPGGDEYELSVRDAATHQPSPASLVVNPTYTYFGNVPDPVVLELTVRRYERSKGGRKSLAVVFSSWLY